MLRTVAFFTSALLLLTGCAPQEVYETEPVQIETSKGLVTCQLYQKHLVLWDEAIDWPDETSEEFADRSCRSFGWRLIEVKQAQNG